MEKIPKKSESTISDENKKLIKDIYKLMLKFDCLRIECSDCPLFTPRDENNRCLLSHFAYKVKDMELGLIK